MVRLLHVVLAVAAWLLLRRGLERAVFVGHAPDPQIAAAFALAVLVASAAGSAALIAVGSAAGRAIGGADAGSGEDRERGGAGGGRGWWSAERALVLDVVSLVAAAWALAVLELGTWPRDLGGVVVVFIVAVRLLPGALAVVAGAPSWIALVVAFGAYGGLASWLPVASLPFGDQVGYLLMADRLAHGTIDATIDPGLFLRTLGIPPTPTDAATHVAATALGPRPIQGYAMPLLLLPGWAIAGRLGAGLVIAAVGAWTSYQMLLILRDLLGAGHGARMAGWTWLVASAGLPTSLLATHLYPNIVGAALVATGFRAGFTAPLRRPAIAAAILALTLFLNPRDLVALVVLVPFLVGERPPEPGSAEGALPPVTRRTVGARPPARRWRLAPGARGVAVAVVAVAIVAVVSNAVLYGVPLPYAGYLFGTKQAQDVTQQPSIVPSFWVGLPAILFDRTLGLAGSAPWLFIGLLGLAPALRRDRARLLPAALTVGLGLAGLSFYRLWEGGYAPPGRYFVDTLPLWIPFVAYGLTVAGGPLLARPRGPSVAAAAASVVAALLLFLGGLTAFVLNAVPSLALNSAFDDKIRDALGRILGVDPLGWLPSFQPLTPTWYVTAYLALIPALAASGMLLWVGMRHDR